QLTKHSRGIHNAWQFWFELALVFTAQCFSSGGLRCSPLNAALVCKRKNVAISQDLVVKAQSLNCRIGVQFQC
ncbi:hypothetical protein BBM51_18980, partial [Vibrio parahaemolyticus]